MSERVTAITQKTLVPLAFVAAGFGVVWGLATDRAKAIGTLEVHDKRIASVETKVDTIVDMQRQIVEMQKRIDARLATWTKP